MTCLNSIGYNIFGKKHLFYSFQEFNNFDTATGLTMWLSFIEALLPEVGIS